MVSFQCHNCGDVVKKPKLDQHRTQCHGGFDCIDCSTTFNSPAEYKGHTSCISEAEKYQKSLYKGPRTGEPAPKNNYPPQLVSEPYPGGSSRGRGSFRGGGGGGGRGGRGGFGNRGGWGQPSSRGTGANDTPLGTSNRRSPVTQPTPAPMKEVPQPPVVESLNESHRGKKRKSMGTEDTVLPNGDALSNKKAKVAQQTDVQNIETVSTPTVTQCKEGMKKEKRSKKEKKSTSTADEAGEKESRKRKKEAVPVDVIRNGSEQVERTVEKESDKEEKKEKKKKRREDQEAATADVEDPQRNSVQPEGKETKSKDKERKKERKEKKGKEDKEIVGSPDDQGTKESSNKKSKRKERKRDVDEPLAAEVGDGKDRDMVEENVVRDDGDTKEAKKKKKKDKAASEAAGSISASGEEVKKKKSKKSKVA